MNDFIWSFNHTKDYNYRPAPIILYVHINLDPKVMSVLDDTDVCTDFRSWNSHHYYEVDTSFTL